MLNLKELTDVRNMSFLHNKPVKCLFSKCRTVYLSNSEPNYMLLRFLNPKNDNWSHESVFLAHKDWPISKMKSPSEFQKHYLSKNGKTSEEITVLLPKLVEDKYNTLLPKKFKPGEVYKLSALKMKHLNQLDTYLNKAGHDWIKLLKKRQSSTNTKPKTRQNRRDPKLHKNKYNASCDADDDFVVETVNAKRVDVQEAGKKRKTKIGAKKKIKRGQKLLPKKSCNRGQVRATSSSYGEKKHKKSRFKKVIFLKRSLLPLQLVKKKDTRKAGSKKGFS